MTKNPFNARPDLGKAWLILLLLVAGQFLVSFLGAFLPMPVIYVAGYILPLIYIYRLASDSGPEDAYTPQFGLMGPFLLILTAVLTEMAVVVLTGAATGWMEVPQWYEELLGEMYTSDLWSNAMTVCVAAPLLEELLFRRVILSGLLCRMPVWKAVAWSSLLFAVAHLNPWQAVPAFVIGCLFGWIYARTGSYWTVVLMHALNNALTIAAVAFMGPDAATLTLEQLAGGLYWPIVALSALVAAAGIWIIYRYVPSRKYQQI